MENKIIQSEKFSENPNPEASIGFVIFFPFQFFVARNIYETMKDRSEFIIDGGSHPVGKIPSGLIRDMVALLEKYGASYRIIYNADYVYPEYVSAFLEKYEALVALWERGCLGIPAARPIKKICLAYGAGKELTMVRTSLGIFDRVLTFGTRDSKLFGLYTTVVTVGNPKFDGWFKNELDSEAITALQQKLDVHKKTILYLPTHSDLCSIEQLAPALKNVASKYNIVVKLHYYTPREEPHLVDALRHPGILLFQDDTDLLSLLKVADIVLSDNSSAIFDAILADRPVVVADFWDKEYLDMTHKQPRFYNRGTAGAITFSGSIEQEIKRDGTITVLVRPDELESKIVEGFDRAQLKKNRLEELKNELFSFNDGYSAERARNSILECLRLDTSNRPILYHAIEAYKTRIGVGSYGEIASLRNQVEVYKSALVDGIDRKILFLSVIIFDRYESHLMTTLKSLFWQSYPADKYEIIVITNRTNEEWKKILGEMPARKSGVVTASLIHSSDIDLSKALESAIELAKGDKIIFSVSGCVLASSWLLDYSVYFDRFPSSVGIGGYLRPLGQMSDSAYFRYRHYMVAKVLHLHPSRWEKGSFYILENNLFYQNPCGMLVNTAYQTDFLREANVGSFETNSWIMIEKFLKWQALKKGRLTFVPQGVSMEAPLTFEDLKMEGFETGMALAVMSQNIPQLKYREVTSLSGAIAEWLNYIFARPWQRKRFLVWVVLRRAFSQWLGYRITVLRLQGTKFDKLGSPSR